MTLTSTRLPSLTLTLLILIFAASGMAFLLALLPAAGHDQLWFLLLAQRILHGATPYGSEAFDSNPPAILWLSTLPVFLAQALHLPVAFTAKLLCLLLILLVATWVPHPFESHPKGSGIEPTARPSSILSPPSLFFLLALLLLTCVAPARDFGQRDHLAAVLLLPYLLNAFALSSRNSTLHRTTLATVAALGVCLKPQQALVPILVELFLAVRARRISRPEPFVFLAVGTLYLAAIQRFAPLYFSSALPTTRATYWAIGDLTLPQLLREAPQLHLLALAAIALALRRSVSPLPAAVPTLLVAGFAATLAYYLQGTGWYYQQLPAITFFGLALALELRPLTLHPPSWLPLPTAALSFLALTLTFGFSGYPFSRQAFADAYTNPITTPDPTFFEGLPPGAAVATLTTSVDDAIMPIFRYHLTWAQRTNNLWTLPALLRAQSIPSEANRRGLTPARLAQLTAQQHRWMVEDLTRWHPALILVARCQDPTVRCQVLEDRHDNLLAFFLRDPAFTAVFAHYRLLRTSGPYDAYTLTSPF